MNNMNKGTAMTNTKLTAFATAILVLGACAALLAGGDALMLPDGARASGVGGGLTSSPGSVDTFTYNPAGLAVVDDAQYVAMYMLWPDGTKKGVNGYSGGVNGYYGAFTYPVEEIGTFAGSLKHFGSSFPHYDAQGNLHGDLTAESIAATAAYGRSFGLLDAGVSLKYVFDGYQNYKFQSLVLDAGGSKMLSPTPKFDLNVGLAVRNIGVNFMRSKNKNSAAAIDMPMNAAISGTLILKGTEKYSLNASAELDTMLVGFDSKVIVSAEVGLKPMLVGRIGYAKRLKGDGALSFGAGLNLPMKKTGKMSKYNITVDGGMISFKDQFGQYAYCLSVTFSEK
jgi:hypothetical protein